MSQNKNKGIVFDLVTGNTEKYEMVFVFLIALMLGLSSLAIKALDTALIIVYSTLAIIFVMSAFKKSEVKEFNEMDVFFQKIAGFGSAIALIGMLFSILGWPGANNMLVTGAVSLLVAFIYILAKDRKEVFGKFTILRIVVLMLISGAFFVERVILPLFPEG